MSAYIGSELRVCFIKIDMDGYMDMVILVNESTKIGIMTSK